MASIFGCYMLIQCLYVHISNNIIQYWPYNIPKKAPLFNGPDWGGGLFLNDYVQCTSNIGPL